MAGVPASHIYYTDDSIELLFVLYTDKRNDVYWDLTGAKIRFQLVDTTVEIKKATANVTGGGDDQILITDATSGTFIVMITGEESGALPAPQDYEFQLQIEKSDGKKYTLPLDCFRLLPTLIDWTDKE